MEQGQNRNRAASKPHAEPLPDPSDTLATKRALNPKPDALRVGQWDRLHVAQSPVSNNLVVTHSREKTVRKCKLTGDPGATSGGIGL